MFFVTLRLDKGSPREHAKMDALNSLCCSDLHRSQSGIAFDHDPALYRLCIDNAVVHRVIRLNPRVYWDRHRLFLCLCDAGCGIIQSHVQTIRHGVGPAFVESAESLGMNGFMVVGIFHHHNR